MRSLGEKLMTVLGFAPADPQDRACFAPALALCLAFIALPLCLLLPIDADRTLPLLLVPAVSLGWKLSRPASPFILGLIFFALVAISASTFLAGHAARALVSASAALWVIAGGMTARNLAPSAAAVRLVLAGISLGAALGALLVARGTGLSYMDFPLYWGPRIFGMHQFAGALAAAYLLRSCLAKTRLAMGLAVLLVIILTGLMASGSRASLLGWGVFAAFWLWRGQSPDRVFILKWAVSLSIAAFLIAGWIGQPFSGMGLNSAIERTAAATNLEGISSARSYFWSVVWHQGIASPFFGHGADAYLYIQPRLHGAQPHNVLLQWFYEYGVAGLVPLGLLLLAGIARSFRPQTLAGSGEWSLQAWASAAVAGTGAVGLFDGAFYHMILFMPAGVFTGLALGAKLAAAGEQSARTFHKFLRPVLLIALMAIVVHGWLGFMLLRAPNVAPDDPAARILRFFPSTSHGLNLWLQRWKTTRPDVVMDWIIWAQSASNQQPEYHLAAVQIHLDRRDFISAERELRACLPKVRDIEVADVERLLAGVSAKAREQAAAAAPPRSAK